jgi:hypothetical protein
MTLPGGARRAILVAMTLLIAGAGVWTIHGHRQGLANLSLCGAIEPGGPRAALVQTFGKPRTIVLNLAKTRAVLIFTSPFFAERPIRAVVNVRDDIVMEIDCGDGRIKTYDKY